LSPEELSLEVAAARQHFEEGLMRAGFVETDTGWVGRIAHGAASTSVVISLPARFPFVQARVVPQVADDVQWSWHREVDGALCVVAEDDHENLWWSEAPAFLEHVTAWFERADASWDGDRSDMDLDRYFETSVRDSMLYLFDDLTKFGGHYVRFDRGPATVMKLATVVAKPQGSPGKTHSSFGFVIDAGVIAKPPRNWEDIRALTSHGDALEEHIRQRDVTKVVIAYKRGDQDGVIVLEVWPNQANGISVKSLLAGADTARALSARSGPGHEELATKSVTIVGVGALGSFIADGLARGGVGKLTLIDGDLLMPGNLVRHLAGREFIGFKKANAVMKTLERRASGLTVDAIDHRLFALDETTEILLEADLVINATADFSVTAMLHAAAIATGTHVLSAALQNDGTTIRIDVLPPLEEALALPSTQRAIAEGAPLFFDNSCGSPISPTPPAAVIEAAGATVRHAVGLLLQRPISPAGEARHLDADHVRRGTC
jgi:hypothetical protein